MRGAAERVGLDDVGAGCEVLAVDLADDVGARQDQQVVVALEIARDGRGTARRGSPASVSLRRWIIVPIAPSRMRMRFAQSVKPVGRVMHRLSVLRMGSGPSADGRWDRVDSDCR